MRREPFNPMWPVSIDLEKYVFEQENGGSSKGMPFFATIMKLFGEIICSTRLCCGKRPDPRLPRTSAAAIYDPKGIGPRPPTLLSEVRLSIAFCDGMKGYSHRAGLFERARPLVGCQEVRKMALKKLVLRPRLSHENYADMCQYERNELFHRQAELFYDTVDWQEAFTTELDLSVRTLARWEVEGAPVWTCILFEGVDEGASLDRYRFYRYEPPNLTLSNRFVRQPTYFLCRRDYTNLAPLERYVRLVNIAYRFYGFNDWLPAFAKELGVQKKVIERWHYEGAPVWSCMLFDRA